MKGNHPSGMKGNHPSGMEGNHPSGMKGNDPSGIKGNAACENNPRVKFKIDVTAITLYNVNMPLCQY